MKPQSMNAKPQSRTSTSLLVHLVLILACGLFLPAAISAKTITVTGTGDSIANDGVVTLREAMTAADKNVASGDAPAGDPGADTIKFNIPGVGLHTIVLSSALPIIVSDPIIIDGTSQLGYAGTPVIELNGNNISATGLFIQAGNSTIKGLVINRFNGRGIILSSGGGNTIVNNYIGTNVAGTADLGNSMEGVFIQSLSSNNVIGGSGANRNVISGNDGDGILISSGTNNIIQANFIGTNAAGTAAIGNDDSGVLVISDNNIVGMGNVISGNHRGITFQTTADGNFVWGNFIGTTFDGMAALGNAQEGILLQGANNQIGGVAAGMRNVVSANGAAGISISGNSANGNSVQGNLIGVKANGSAALGNSSAGVRVADGSNNLIGGTAPAQRNVISGNVYGVSILGASATGNTLQGNYIGVDSTGNVKLANSGMASISAPQAT
jgi:hypothetical protein